ncbi:MAG TPA: (Fe-S)-binding protein, partial [bacterium]|nr:(Fe-S)-binding protein [bacterium]
MFEEYSKQLNLCKTCPSLCQSACPVFINDGNKTHSPQGLMQLVNNVRHKQLPFDEQIASEAYHCLECRACTQACEHHVDVPQILRQVRTEAIRQELAPQPINTFIERFHKHNNPFARDLAGKLRSLLPARYFNANASAIYFSSCTTIAKCPEVIRDTFALFNKLKIDFVNLYADPIHCCGYPLLCCGAEYEFVDLAEINFHSLKKFKTIITNCPACAHTLKHTYAKYAFNLEAQVITISDFLKPYLKPLRAALKKNIRTKTIFHDSCYATRYLDDPDTSRDIITQATGHAPTRFYDH